MRLSGSNYTPDPMLNLKNETPKENRLMDVKKPDKDCKGSILFNP